MYGKRWTRGVNGETQGGMGRCGRVVAGCGVGTHERNATAAAGDRATRSVGRRGQQKYNLSVMECARERC